MAALLAEFNTYLDQEHALLARRDNEPTPDRSPYLASPILFPLGEPAQRAGRT
jgi:hypothetical protein